MADAAADAAPLRSASQASADAEAGPPEILSVFCCGLRSPKAGDDVVPPDKDEDGAPPPPLPPRVQPYQLSPAGSPSASAAEQLPGAARDPALQGKPFKTLLTPNG